MTPEHAIEARARWNVSSGTPHSGGASSADTRALRHPAGRPVTEVALSPCARSRAPAPLGHGHDERRAGLDPAKGFSFPRRSSSWSRISLLADAECGCVREGSPAIVVRTSSTPCSSMILARSARFLAVLFAQELAHLLERDVALEVEVEVFEKVPSKLLHAGLLRRKPHP